jgi:hypothetical protein
MQTNVIWTGRLYNSIENCIITETAQENNIVSTIIGWLENQLFKVDYHIRTNTNWETLFVQIRTRLDDHTGLVTLERKNGQWLLNGELQPAFHQLVHVDISLTPFTNTLPVRELLLDTGTSAVIEVIYFNILEKEISPIKQVYTMNTPAEYVYENYDKNFRAVLTVDEQGLVTHYPTLFDMRAKRESHYAGADRLIL